MTQQEVYDLLKKYRNKWLSAREIAKLQNASFNTIRSNLRRLREGGIITCKTVLRFVEPAGKKPIYIYRYRK